MDDGTLSRIIEGLLGIVLGGMSWFMLMIHGKTQKTSEDLAAYKTEVAQTYASKSDMEDIKDDLKEVKGDIKQLLQRVK